MTNSTNSPSFQQALHQARLETNTLLETLLPLPTGYEKRVVEAMRYAAIGTGKALRPFLVLTVARLCHLSSITASRIAAALEMVHTYSLIHDDLPAMDNDTMRRGKPTVHIAFDEATAILAGDALLTQAFDILAAPETHPHAEIRCLLVQNLAQTAGKNGMIGGQMLDLIGEKTTYSLTEIERMQALKTGALLWYACLAPAMAAKASKSTQAALEQYARAIGLLFQITDDILDIEGSSKTMGKTLGKDITAHKSTFVSLLGMPDAKKLALELEQQALDALEPFGEEANLLRETVRYIMERDK